MPDAPKRPCAGGCGALVTKGRCARCSRQTEQRRGSAASRGYGWRWNLLRIAFIRELVNRQVPPVCGARLDGLSSADSLCTVEGLFVFDGLDCDHIEAHEGNSDPRFWDMSNLQLLCHDRCHARKTATKDGGFGSRAHAY